MQISLRKKIYIHFCVFMAVNGLIWFLSYYGDYELNQKLQIIDKKNDLLSTVLEARRYEKNFFLDGDRAHLKQAIAYVDAIEYKLRHIINAHGKYTLTRDFNPKLADIRAYDHALQQLLATTDAGVRTGKAPEESVAVHKKISEMGHRITEDFDQLVRQERLHVRRLIGRSRFGFFSSMGALLLLSVLTTLFLIFNVTGPLKSIEDAIHKIAKGDYTSIPTVKAGYEFESLVSSLNEMINELNRRGEHLVQMEKLASLGTLTSGVAHELNNPLNNISTSLQILMEELEDADLTFKREMLAEAGQQVDRARDIVRALLEFARQSAFSRKPVYIRTLVDKTIGLIRSEIPGNISLSVGVPEKTEACVDPARIQQVLINLMMNGIHAMTDSGGVLDIRCHMCEAENALCLQIQDRGVGIPEENRSRIFDPFFTTKGVGKGSGLGLSVSHGIIEQHGGRIEVDSVPGRGTTFNIYLPCQEDK
ncbi:sensor histidine kinase [Desulfonema ishimotonii]|uniref:histidine kinase n=1 Tax=Desulfonema ishimotonii TaxID=45657 RepID=A0A401G1Q0_9BACT|nr:ATP-binding protein [Desulfonema ishimotonii]GBC63168.1 sensor histidine kinase [Desulfonema ishimotonii]